MLDKKYNALEKEAEKRKYWEENEVYKFDENSPKQVYSIDTPPPTVNGKIHIGHIFSYSQTEMLARYKRLRGFNIFYPFGFDDNGLPSERLVEKEQGKRAHEIGREEFSKLCYATTDKYEAEFKELFNKMAVSTDWSNSYKTVSPETIRISQASFLDLVSKNKCYHGEAPALWCNECLTTIAQAELETKTKPTTFNHVFFETKETNEKFKIATTRPELLPAIVAVFVNPEDEKNEHLIGKTAVIPVVNEEVPILADEKVDMEKGTGIVMSCTFGDQTDIEWWRKYKLPLKNIFTKDGKIESSVPNYGGMWIKEARKKVVEDLKEAGAIDKIEDHEHEVQVHERCGREVEYTVMKQWFIDIMNHKKDFLEIGNKINWHPKHMKSRYDEWVNNVMWDWCISRQRYFGVPFPVWHEKETGKPVFASVEELPVNPLVDRPKGYENVELVPELDVMDTWATSSITPLINMRYGRENNLEDKLRPMSVRTNASEIIRTWDFYTIVKSFYHFGEIPWENVMISGFVMASKGQKISKSKGNSKIDPVDLLKEVPADYIRYWAGTGRLGMDIVYSDETVQRGKKLVNKLFNVSKFIEMHLGDYTDLELNENEFEYFDKYILNKFMEVEKGFIKYLEEYEVGLALNHLEKFFWNFCDNYIEIVKHRLYRPEEFGEKARLSGQKTVYTLLFKLLQDFSIYLPYIAEEVYMGIYKENMKIKSIHNTEIKELTYNFEGAETGEDLIEIISFLRGEKTKNGVSLKTEIENVTVYANEKVRNAIKEAEKDLKATLFINNLEVKELTEEILNEEANKLEENVDNISFVIKDVKLNIEEK